MLSCRGSTREFYTASSTATRQREYRWVMTSTSQNYKNTVFKHLDLAPHKQQTQLPTVFGHLAVSMWALYLRIQQSTQVTAAWTLKLLPEEINQDAQSLSTVVPISGLPERMLCVLGSTRCPWNRINIYFKEKRNFTNILPNWASMTHLLMGKSWHSLGINGPYNCYRHLSNKQTECSHMCEVWSSLFGSSNVSAENI